MSGICPHCGYDLAVDEPVVIGALSIDPRGPIIWHGSELALTPYERVLLTSVAKAYPQALEKLVLADRMGSDSDWNSIEVLIHRVRRKLAHGGHDVPLKTERGIGLRWAA